MGEYDYTPRQMWDAVCTDCGDKCSVPFEPDNVRPVFCRDCLSRNRRLEDNRAIKNKYND